jgi:DNA-binding NarL/FixJ family response regulator
MNMLVISDQPMVAVAWRTLLCRVDPTSTLVHVPHWREARELLSDALNPGYVVLDLDTRGAAGLAGAATVRGQWPTVPLLVMPPTPDGVSPECAALLGLQDVLPKTLPTEALESALARILDGERTPGDTMARSRGHRGPA